MELPLKSSERPALNKAQTAIKMSLIPVIATVISSVTYDLVKTVLSPEVYTGALISVLIGIKDLLKYKWKII